MKKTPTGTSVGVDDPYEHAGICEYATSDGRCRYAFEYPGQDPEFSSARRADEFRCPVADDEWQWRECPHYRFRATDRECARCGLEERRDALDDGRPLLEEHHLSYDDARDLGNEITVYLCRWCHAKVHDSWARVGDDVGPDPEAIAAQEERRGREQSELAFESAADRMQERDG